LLSAVPAGSGPGSGRSEGEMVILGYDLASRSGGYWRRSGPAEQRLGGCWFLEGRRRSPLEGGGPKEVEGLLESAFVRQWAISSGRSSSRRLEK